jgi:hypothetical protein
MCTLLIRLGRSRSVLVERLVLLLAPERTVAPHKSVPLSALLVVGARVVVEEVSLRTVYSVALAVVLWPMPDLRQIMVVPEPRLKATQVEIPLLQEQQQAAAVQAEQEQTQPLRAVFIMAATVVLAGTSQRGRLPPRRVITATLLAVVPVPARMWTELLATAVGAMLLTMLQTLRVALQTQAEEAAVLNTALPVPVALALWSWGIPSNGCFFYFFRFSQNRGLSFNRPPR